MKKFVFTVFSIAPLIILLIGYAFAVPSDPPLTGKAWVESDGSWILVIAPPGDGPYIWRDGEWGLGTWTRWTRWSLDSLPLEIISVTIEELYKKL